MQPIGPQVRVVEPLLRGVAEQPLDLRADVGGGCRSRFVAGVPDVGDRRDPLDDRAVAVLRLLQPGLGLLLAGDVEHDPLRPDRVAVLVAGHHQGVVSEPEHPPVLGEDPVLLVEGRAGSIGIVGGAADPLAVVGMHRFEPQLGVVAPLLRGVAEDRLELRADVDGRCLARGTRGVPGVRDRRDLLHHGLEPALVDVLCSGGVAATHGGQRQERDRREPDRRDGAPREAERGTHEGARRRTGQHGTGDREVAWHRGPSPSGRRRRIIVRSCRVSTRSEPS